MNELISNEYELDLSENIAIPLNFAIGDFLEPSKRQRHFSKEIVLPDTSNNRAFFASSFSLHVTDASINFDSTQSINAKLLKNGVPILPNGIIRLKEVIRLDKDLTFKIQLFSETIDIFNFLSNIKVNELDWSSYDHTLTQANITSSWLTIVGSGYVYPLIERGATRPALTTWRTTDMIPYVFHNDVLTKVLDYAGISYSSTFLDSSRYKHVLFGYGGGDLPEVTTADANLQKVDIDNGDYNFSQSTFCKFGS